MAAIVSSTANVPFPIICCAFQLPRGPPEYFNIKKALGPLNEEANEKMTALQSMRENLESLYGAQAGGKSHSCIIPQCQLSSLAPASEVLSCMSSYYQLLTELIVSLGADPESIRIADSCNIEWPSPLTRTAVKVRLTTIATGKHLLGALYMESCMLLVNRAYMMSEEARATVGTLCTCTSEYKKAADVLCRAAGILDFVAFKIENDWSTELSNLVSVEQRPIETTPVLCHGLRDIYIAQAQGMAVAQTMSSGSYKASVLCKLSQGVTQLMQSGVSKLECIPSYSNVTGIAAKGIGEKHSSITHYWKFYTSVWNSLSHRFMGELEWEKGSYGKAIAYQDRAVELSKSVNEPFLGELARINSPVLHWRNYEAATLGRYKGENSTIYYDPIPTELDVLLSAVVIMKPVPFSDPDVVPFSLAIATTSDNLPSPPPVYNDVVESPVSASLEDLSVPVEPSAAHRRLEGMGFEASKVAQALAENNQNEQAAIETLLSNT